MERTFEGRPCPVLELLKSDAYAETVLLDAPGGRVVLKTSRFRPWPALLRPLFRAIGRREQRIYRRVTDLPIVPPFLGASGPDAFAHRYVEGTTIAHVGWLPDAFFAGLEAGLRAMHERGIAYVDLAKEENVLVSPDGRPFLVDFQISADFGDLRGPLAGVRRALHGLFVRQDLYHLAKHKRLHRPDLVIPEEAARLRRKGTLSRIYGRTLKPLYNLATRRITRVSARRPGRERPARTEPFRPAGAERAEERGGGD